MRRKYTGTVWSVIFLAMFGADGRDPAVRRGCEYVLDHSRARAPYGGFTALMELYPSGMVQCLGGNLCRGADRPGLAGRSPAGRGARLAGAQHHRRRDRAGGRGAARGANPDEDEVVRYFRGGNSGPGFECAANSRKPCAWGAVKAMLALSKVPEPARTPTMQAAVATGTRFPARPRPRCGRLPHPGRPPAEPELVPARLSARLRDRRAAKPGGADRAGPRRRPTLANALAWLLAKQDAAGRWKMEYTYNGKMWQDVEQKGEPSKWVTLRALRVLKRAA